MTTRNLLSAACLAVLAAVFLHVPEVSAQSISGAPPAIQMVSEDGKGAEKKRSHSRPDGVMDAVGLPVGEGLAITLEVAIEKEGQPVIVTPLDGGKILATFTSAEGETSLSAYGTDLEDNVFVAEDGTQHRESTFVADDGTVDEQGLFIVDGGTVRQSSLFVSKDGKVGFSFQAGDTTGLYRVQVTVGSDQYELQLYAVVPPVNQ